VVPAYDHRFMKPATASPSRLTVLMFTDVADSTAMKSRLGATEFARLLAAHDERFRSIVSQIQGAAVLKDLGDGFMATFETASTAVQAALQFQHALMTGFGADGDSGKLRARIGLHLGEVTDVGTDIHGQPKIIGLAADLAARVAALALPGQILLTRSAFDDSRQ
jgi:class 3 adenylate cyclase